MSHFVWHNSRYGWNFGTYEFLVHWTDCHKIDNGLRIDSKQNTCKRCDNGWPILLVACWHYFVFLFRSAMDVMQSSESIRIYACVGCDGAKSLTAKRIICFRISSYSLSSSRRPRHDRLDRCLLNLIHEHRFLAALIDSECVRKRHHLLIVLPPSTILSQLTKLIKKSTFRSPSLRWK